MQDRILAMFRQQTGGYISGGELAKQLGCSRTAVWKHIELLREQGFEFEASSRRGYRLAREPQRIDLAAVTALLTTRTIGRNIRYYDEVGSTNAVAHEIFEREDVSEGTLIVAESQTAGRGRMGRHWHSPKGKGVWMSFILKPRISLQFAPQLTLLTAVALCRSIRRDCAVEAGIKWPNDLLIGGKKVSGILLESSAEDERIKYAVCGIGISVNLQSEDYPPELMKIATSLAIESGREIAREPLIASFLNEFEQLFDLYHNKGFEPIRLLWEALSVSLHRPIRVQTAQGPVEGTASGIDESGALNVVLADGKTVKVFSGEVELRR